jgi:hypothetical protein
MNAKEIVESVFNKKVSSLQETTETILAEKVNKALNERRIAMAKNYFAQEE